MDQLNLDVQTQMYIVSGIALVSIFTSMILLVLSCLLITKVNRLKRVVEQGERAVAVAVAEEKGGPGQDQAWVLSPQFRCPRIHPQEELGRRGFTKYPDRSAPRVIISEG